MRLGRGCVPYMVQVLVRDGSSSVSVLGRGHETTLAVTKHQCPGPMHADYIRNHTLAVAVYAGGYLYSIRHRTNNMSGPSSSKLSTTVRMPDGTPGIRRMRARAGRDPANRPRHEYE